MSQDFDRLSLKELFTDVEAFVAFSLVILTGLGVLLYLMLTEGMP
jgi:hypothetical protein